MRAYTPKQIVERYQRIRGERGNWENTWQQIGDFMLPRKADFQVTRYPGEPRYQHILDNIGMVSGELLSGALHSMLTNPSGYFFSLSTGNPDLDAVDSVRRWLQEVVRRMHDTMANSNFHTETHEFKTELVYFGTAGMTVEDDEESIVRFGARDLRELYIDENAWGVVDTIYRCFELDARGIVDLFGYDEIPEQIKKCYDEGKSQKFEIIHAVYPVPRGSEGPNKFLSHYVLVKDRSDLKVSGFRENPYVVARWSKAAGEKYGRGPGERALPEVKMLQKMMETTIKGAQKTVDPPLQVPDDGYVYPIDTTPGGLNYVRADGNAIIRPIFNDARIDFGFQFIEIKQRAVREAFYVDQLRLREGPQMTATEVMERTEQAMRFMGPILARLTNEWLQPVVERTYNIMDRKGMLPEVPVELEGVRLTVQFSSLMAVSQRMTEIQNIQRTMANIAPFASADPSVLDNFDGDKAVRYVGKLFNFPQEIIRDVEDRDGIRQQRAEQQAQMQQQAMEAQQADSASKLVSAAARM